MMRQYQARASRKATRIAIERTTSTGLIGTIRHYNRFALYITLAALIASIVLLFIGTFVYFNASIEPNDGTQSSSMIIDKILYIYGINEADFRALLPMERHFDHLKLNNYQIGVSMMFVATISILIEVGLICSILFEHFKLSMLYTIIMVVSIIFGLRSQMNNNNNNNNDHDSVKTSGNVASITTQIAYTFIYCLFTCGIKVKQGTARRLMKQRRVLHQHDDSDDLELQSNCADSDIINVHANSP